MTLSESAIQSEALVGKRQMIVKFKIQTRATALRSALARNVPYWRELARLENMLLALDPTSRVTQAAIARKRANIIAYSATS